MRNFEGVRWLEYTGVWINRGFMSVFCIWIVDCHLFGYVLKEGAWSPWVSGPHMCFC